nr:relaxin receptor 1-like [Leptinotarsa decemlineata]
MEISFFRKLILVCIIFFTYVFITFMLYYSDTDYDSLKRLETDVSNNSTNFSRVFPKNGSTKYGANIMCSSTPEISCKNELLLSYLNLSGNHLKYIPVEVLVNQVKLKILHLSHNYLSLDNETFPKMYALEKLYLENNFIRVVSKNIFRNLTKLRQISLANNRIESVDPGSFEVLNELTELNLYNNCLTVLDSSTFMNQKNLTKLYLGRNSLENLPRTIFKNLTQLQHLNLGDIDILKIDASMFDSLKELKRIELKNLICRYNKVLSCRASDGISSANNILNKGIFRFWNWVISSAICISNFLVIFSRLFYRDENKILNLVIRNLAASDFLMGVYLIIIGIYDVKFRGVYGEMSEQWLSSWTCTFTGITAMISSEVTVFILLFISIDRYLVIVTSYGKYKSLNEKDTVIVLTIIWCLGIAISVIPVIRYADDTKFYGINGLCFPLHIAYPYYSGWQYTAFIIFGINATSLIIIAFVYIGMFISIRKTREATPLPKKVYEFVLRFFFIVFIYGLCWLPIIVFKTAAYAGADISDELYGWLVVFILPINSASNPILYTFTTRKYRAKMKISCIFEGVMDRTHHEDPSLTDPSDVESDCGVSKSKSTTEKRF